MDSMTGMQRFREWRDTDDIVHHLPVLRRWMERAAQEQPLAGVTALMLQHQLGNQVPQTRALLDLGLDPKQLHWIDIPYTSTERVRDEFRKMGVPAENMVPGDFRLLDNYAPYQRLRVQRYLRELAKDPPEHLLVLDDGSYLIEALASMKLRLPRISIVEQTTRGIIKMEEDASLEACSREFPIVNVAKSRPKTVLEPPFIGLAVCDALQRKFAHKLTVSPKDRCLVLGYGAIGEQVAEFARTVLGFASDRVHVHDVDEGKMRRAVAAGFRAWNRGERGYRFRLVLGCSGRASFRVGDHVLLEDGAYLASATSGTVELSREQFVELADANDEDDIWIVREGLDERQLHSDLKFHFVGQEATFVNGGFPVNFDGRINCVPMHYIQPTPTMMCAAAVQAVKSDKRGLEDMEPEFCEWLEDDFRRELGEEESALPPR